MSWRDWRTLLHLIGVLGWIAGLVADAEERRGPALPWRLACMFLPRASAAA